MTAVLLAQYADFATYFLAGAVASNPLHDLYGASPLTVVGSKLLLIGVIGFYHGTARNSVNVIATAAGLIGTAVNTVSALLG